jgi:putative addiction module component (TIGR02574 family)
MTVREQIFQQALALPPEDREQLADLLERSLPTEGFVNSDVADAWSEEIERRIAAYDRGETVPIDLDQSLINARKALEAHRVRKGVQ